MFTAHPLEVRVDLHGRDDRPQVGRHRLVQRQQPEAPVVHLDVELVDRLVAEQDLAEERRVPGNQALDRRAHALLGQAAHLQQPALQGLELLTEMRYLSLH